MIAQLRNFVQESDERVGGNNPMELLSVSQTRGVIPRSQITENEARADSFEKYKVVKVGDIVLNRFNAYRGSLGKSSISGMVSPDYAVLRPNDGHSSFLEYWLRSDEISQAMKASMGGLGASDPDSSGFSRVDVRALLRLPIEKVQPESFDQIAEFLDRETTQIDALIEKQQQLIQTLGERRKAVITRAVTRGLDPTFLMRPSGIGWLPTVPSHWKVIPMKHVVRLQSGETISGEDIEPEGNYPVFGGNGFRGYTDSFTHSGEYVLIGRQGALCGNVNLARGDFWASEHAIVAHPLMDFPLTWLGFLLESMNLGQYSMTAAQPGISADLVARLGLPLPPPEERQRISEYLDRETSQIDGLSGKATDMIALLKERRQALISAAVTGKIDVRGK